MKTYPARWWKKQDPHFFPTGRFYWHYPQPNDEADPLFDRYGEGLITNEVVLPCQLEPDVPQRIDRFPLSSQRLALGIIDQAREDIESYCRRYGEGESIRNPSAFRSAWEWVFDDDEHYTFSFLNCCVHTGTDPQSIRNDCTKLLAVARRLGAQSDQLASFKAAMSLRKLHKAGE